MMAEMDATYMLEIKNRSIKLKRSLNNLELIDAKANITTYIDE